MFDPDETPANIDDSAAELVRCALESVMRGPGGRKCLITRLAAVAVVFGDMKQQEVCARLGVSKSTLSRGVDGLRTLLRGSEEITRISQRLRDKRGKVGMDAT